MISHHHKCIFVHVPKAAGQSIEHAFADDLGLSWRNQLALQMGKNADPAMGPPDLSHLVAADYVKLKYVPKEMFDEYCTFAVIRNPWARVVSTYRYLNIHVPFSYFVHELLPGDLWRRLYYFLRPQTEFVCDAEGNVIVDRIIRFENLLPEFYEICDQVGLPRALPHVNASENREGHRYLRVRARQAARALSRRNLKLAAYAVRQKERFQHHTDYYDAESRRRVAELYRSDIQAFGYSFE